MNWNNHSDLAGTHAFLGASNYHWLNYDRNKLEQVYRNNVAAQLGTELHDYAARSIRLRKRLASYDQPLNRYVNDAIGFKMDPEVTLFYSHTCFGTADAISFRDNILRIHDLKTGTTPGNMRQLMIYAALFCLEYRVKPADIQFMLRIYQSKDVVHPEKIMDDLLVEQDGVITYLSPQPQHIQWIMDTIVQFDKWIGQIQKQEA